MINKMTKKILISGIIILIVIVGVLIYLKKSAGPTNLNSTSQYPQLQEVSGIIQDVALSAKVITIKESAGNEINLALTDAIIFYDEDDNKVDISFFKRGMWVTARGERTNETSLIPEWVKEGEEAIEPFTPDEVHFVTDVSKFIDNFMKARLERNQPLAESFLTDNAKKQYSQTGLTLTGMSNPHFVDRDLLGEQKIGDGKYLYKVRIYEAYTGEPITGYFNEILTVIKSGDSYLIDSVERSKYFNPTISYRNNQYGFIFNLPQTWQGYSVVEEQWQGYQMSEKSGEVLVEQGPQILLRHPQWTSQNPRQDIPIMVFTLSQWNSLLQGEYSVSAAGIGPGEFGRNAKYVFGLPARYNVAFSTGWEEVQKILDSHPLHAF